MAMISNVDYVLHAVRLSALRTTDDSITPRIITLDPAFGTNPYISTMGLGDIDSWPEIKRALDSPPPEPSLLDTSPITDNDDVPERSNRRGLRYTQTIVPAGRAGAGMRVNQREDGANVRARRALRPAVQRATSSSTQVPTKEQRPPTADELDDLFTSPPVIGRRRSGSEPPVLTSAPVHASALEPATPFHPATLAPGALVASFSDSELAKDGYEALSPASAALKMPSHLAAGYYPESSSMGIAESAMPSDLAMTVGDTDPLAEGAVDEGSDVDEDEAVDEDVAPAPPVVPPTRPGHIRQISHHVQRGAYNRVSVIHEDDRRSSIGSSGDEKLEFKRVPVAAVATPAPSKPPVSSLTALLNQHVPHLVSTGDGAAPPEPSGPGNPFASLYATVAAPPTVPSLSLEIFFPHSEDPSEPIHVQVRKDATVEEVTGHGLWKAWEEGRLPPIEDELELSTIGWGLRIVEDDGEVDEDFPALDRDSQVSKFAYGEFGIVKASDSQRKQNAAMAPLIVRRPSRIIAAPPGQQRQVQAAPKLPIVGSPTSFMDTAEGGTLRTGALASSGGSAAVLLRVLVRVSADMTFTTTISVPFDTYIADLTEVLVQKKHLQQPASEWVLCLADLSLALPLDRTVASLEGQTDLTLVRRQWASEHGLRGDMRGGDPSASIFKRVSEPIPNGFGRAAGDFSQTYKKFTVMRKTPIGRHERLLTIDFDYIRILPSENRAFFDTMKSTSIPIALVANCKLSGRGGGFKIYVWRDGNTKRYEFEADNGKQASDIVASIKQLMKAYHSTDRQSMARR